MYRSCALYSSAKNACSLAVSFLVLVSSVLSLVSLSSLVAAPALAQSATLPPSAACTSINTGRWSGGGYTVTPGDGGQDNDGDYWEDLTLGETITWRAISNPANSDASLFFYILDDDYDWANSGGGEFDNTSGQINTTGSGVITSTDESHRGFGIGWEIDNSSATVSGSITIELACNPAPAPAPDIASLSPTSGATAGGDTVVITGTNFTGATAVTFGGVAADDYTVNSETQITVLSPPHAAGVVDVIVTTAAGTDTASDSYTYIAPTIVLSPSAGALTAGQAGLAYTLGFTASGGTTPHSFTVGTGALPAGLTLDEDGTLSGTPTAVGDASFTITATDADDYPGSAAYTLSIAAPVITVSPTTLTGGTVSSAYSQTITASGGTGSYTYSQSSGTIPPGLTLSTDGTLSGTPTADGTFTFTVAATDSTTGTGAPFTSSRSYSLSIADIAPIANDVTRTVSANSTNNTITLDITGGTPTSVAIDTGLINGTATVSGTSVTYTPTIGFSGTDSFTYTAENATGTSATATVTIDVTPITPTISNISPDRGSTLGGDSITITGFGFGSASGVSIGGVPATNVVRVNDGTITATTPEMIAGAHDVVIDTGSGSLTLVNGFTAEPTSSEPVINGAVSPNSGPTSGGTTVTISGYGFSAATGVNFGAVAAASFTIVNDQKITAVSPPQAVGSVDVEVTGSPGASLRQ